MKFLNVTIYTQMLFCIVFLLGFLFLLHFLYVCEKENSFLERSSVQCCRFSSPPTPCFCKNFLRLISFEEGSLNYCCDLWGTSASNFVSLYFFSTELSINFKFARFPAIKICVSLRNIAIVFDFSVKLQRNNQTKYLQY